MAQPNLDIQTLFDTQLPDSLAVPLLNEIRMTLEKSEIKVVVLDDDPTGTQTVHDVPVITNWEMKLLQKTAEESPRGFFILTNTRSLPEKEAVQINKTIAQQLKQISEDAGIHFMVISRGDSTLRGHFPAETISLDEGFRNACGKYLLMPYFLEGGRYTIDNIHYVLEGKKLVPVAKTFFARDKSFGYTSSDLRDYIEEKTNGRIHHKQVKSISIEQLNAGVTEAVMQLEKISQGEFAVVNATCPYHAAVIAMALVVQWQKGAKYLVRCSASLVQALFGMNGGKILDEKKFETSNNHGGLIIAGSYVKKSTEQLDHLQSNTEIYPIEMDVLKILEDHDDHYVHHVAMETDKKLASGQSVLLYTSRKLVTTGDAHENLNIGKRISQAIVRIVREIRSKPKFIIAKGGITSSDIATQSLHMEKAMIAGQILPGVPVWIQGAEAKFPGMPYIIFPGNVGTTEYLTTIFKKLSAHEINIEK